MEQGIDFRRQQVFWQFIMHQSHLAQCQHSRIIDGHRQRRCLMKGLRMGITLLTNPGSPGSSDRLTFSFFSGFFSPPTTRLSPYVPHNTLS
jgi:hypothetical protein